MLSLLCHNRLKPFSLLITRRQRWHTTSLLSNSTTPWTWIWIWCAVIISLLHRLGHRIHIHTHNKETVTGRPAIATYNYYGVFQHLKKQLLMTTLIKRRVLVMAMMATTKFCLLVERLLWWLRISQTVLSPFSFITLSLFLGLTSIEYLLVSVSFC